MKKYRKYFVFICVMLLSCFLTFLGCKEEEASSIESSSMPISSAETLSSTQESSIPQSSDLSSNSVEESSVEESSVEESSFVENSSSEESTGLEEENSSLEEESSSSEEISSSEEPPHSHDWVEESRVEYCTKPGTLTYICHGCGEKKAEDLPALNHDEVTDEAVSATCEVEGKTEGSHCSRCGEILCEQENLGFSDHCYVEHICKWCDSAQLNFVVIQGEYYCTGTDATYARRVVIPDNYKGYPVTGIAKNAFACCHALNSLTIGKNVETIEEGAFDCCDNLMEIYDYSDAVVTSVPANMTLLSNYVKDIYTEPTESRLHQDENGYITYKDRENEIWFVGYRGAKKDLVLPDGITIININSFAMCEGLRSVVISDTVKKIRTRGFAFCPDLVKVTIGRGVNYIGNYAFDVDNNLQEVVFLDPYNWVTWSEDMKVWVKNNEHDMCDPVRASYLFQGEQIGYIMRKES